MRALLSVAVATALLGTAAVAVDSSLFLWPGSTGCAGPSPLPVRKAASGQCQQGIAATCARTQAGEQYDVLAYFPTANCLNDNGRVGASVVFKYGMCAAPNNATSAGDAPFQLPLPCGDRFTSYDDGQVSCCTDSACGASSCTKLVNAGTSGGNGQCKTGRVSNGTSMSFHSYTLTGSFFGGFNTPYVASVSYCSDSSRPAVANATALEARADGGAFWVPTGACVTGTAATASRLGPSGQGLVSWAVLCGGI